MMKHRTTSTARVRTVTALVALTALGLSSCGKAAELGTERLIESQSGGEIDLDLNGDGGFAIDTEEGGMRIDENGNFVITDKDGNVVTGSADSETGNLDIGSEDGSFRMDSSGEVPAEWPGEVPSPAGLDDATSTVQITGDDVSISMSGRGDTEFVENYGTQLEAAGYEQTSSSDSPGNISRVYESATRTVVVGAFGEAGDQAVSIMVLPND